MTLSYAEFRTHAALLFLTLGCASPQVECTPGDTRTCHAEGGCLGGQSCNADGEWEACDCGGGAGGAAGDDEELPKPPHSGALACDELDDFVSSAIDEVRACTSASACVVTTEALRNAILRAAPDAYSSAVNASVDQAALTKTITGATPTAGCIESDTSGSPAATGGARVYCRDGSDPFAHVGPTCSREGECIVYPLCACANGDTIQLGFECDGREDCADGSDERDCNGPAVQGPGASAECPAIPGVTSCLLADAGCGLTDPNSGACVPVALVDPDCPSGSRAPSCGVPTSSAGGLGCCTEEGLCGTLSGSTCRVAPGPTTSCDGRPVPFTCGDTVCTLHESLGVPPCCGSEGDCGVEVDGECKTPTLDTDCPSYTYCEAGCCLESGLCGTVDPESGECSSERGMGTGPMTAPSPPSGDVTTPTYGSACDGSEVALCGEIVCPEGAGCCTESGGCGWLATVPGNSFESVCLGEEQFDPDCANGCCTADGYCGAPAGDGTCQAFVDFGTSTDCEGRERPFACGETACTGSRGFGSVTLAACCTEADACGVYLSGECVDETSLDPSCPDVSGSPGCCRNDGVCGVWDAVAGACLAVQGQTASCQ